MLSYNSENVSNRVYDLRRIDAGAEVIMKFNYNKLWKLLIDRKMMKKDLMEKTKITGTTIAKMGRGEPVNLTVLGRICKELDVNIGDIVDFEK